MIYTVINTHPDQRPADFGGVHNATRPWAVLGPRGVHARYLSRENALAAARKLNRKAAETLAEGFNRATGTNWFRGL